MSEEGRDYVVACVIATEVPPQPTGTFTAEMILIGIRAVCAVIRNRVAAAFAEDAVGVVLAPKQFSAVCREDYWRKAMAGRWFPGHVAKCLHEWQHPAPVPIAVGATYYYSPVSMVPPGRVPDWVAGKTEVLVPGLDRQYFRFYRP